MSELILVRHGQASFGAESYDKLSPAGEQQVSILAEHWQALGQGFDRVYSGTLQRQQQTAALLAPVIHEADAAVMPAFDEYDGEPLIRIYLRDHAVSEGFSDQLTVADMDRKAFQQVLEASTRHWLAGTLKPSATDTDFESWQAFKKRVHEGVDELMARHSNGSRVLLATSGGVIGTALQRILDLSDSQAIACSWMVNNSSVTRFAYGQGRVSLACFNSLAHLESPDRQALITFR